MTFGIGLHGGLTNRWCVEEKANKYRKRFGL